MIATDYEPNLEEDKIGGLLGAKKASQLSPAIERKLDYWGDRLTDRMEPQVSHIVRDIEKIENGKLYIRGGETIISPKICRVLARCNQVVLFIATIGEEVSGSIDRLMKKNHMSDAYIADTIGSVAVESIVDQFHLDMEADYRRKGRSVTIRFSPGYCDWHIREQKKVFRMMKSLDHDVELTDTYLMEPRKSVSGLFGIWPYKVGGSVASYNPCRECSKTDCIARRA